MLRRNKPQTKKASHDTDWAKNDPPLLKYDGKWKTAKDKQVLSQVENIDRNEQIKVYEYRAFSLLVHLGFQNLYYTTQIHELNDSFYGISRNRAQKIGQALTNNMRYLGISLTTVEENALTVLAQEIDGDITIEELSISHITGDEVTVIEALGMARIFTNLKTKSIHIRAQAFEEGALNALCQELNALNNVTLREYDICKTSQTEPHDQKSIPALDLLIKQNQ